MADYSVELIQLIDTMKLENCTPEVNVADIKITQNDINRSALQLTGFFDYFDSDRIQVIGQVEYTYMEKIGGEKSKEMLKKIMEHKVPCIVFCRSLDIKEEFLEMAREYQVPILRTAKTTSGFVAEVIRWLNVELAPRMTVHGVLVDVYGEGLLIMGESGIGKSEAALELIKRGHRLVSDDVVEIKRVSDITLIGTAPDITRHFIELRGIGILDVKNLFGVESVKDTQSIDLVIKLEEWNKEQEYDRLGLEEEYTEFLGNKVVCHSIPIRPGRNLAVICEAAAVNYRQKKMGYNAAQELYNRVTNNIMNKE
ncbi:MAG: HPr(Ser) kinase/phosphatase [Clostridiales bacterium]|nr:HPr(Ser) kinase/phosphatase [Clostridiales bacterium]